MSRRSIGYLLLILLTLLTLAFIFGNSLQTAVSSNQASDSLLEQVDPIVDPLLQGITGSKPDDEQKSVFIRKLAHFLEFALLGAELFALAIYHKKAIVPSFLFAPAFLLLASAVTDELIQSFGDRTDSVRDVCLDFCGGITGGAAAILLCALIILWKKKKEKPPCNN